MTDQGRIKRLASTVSFSISRRRERAADSRIPIIHGTGGSHRRGTEPWMAGAAALVRACPGERGSRRRRQHRTDAAQAGQLRRDVPLRRIRAQPLLRPVRQGADRPKRTADCTSCRSRWPTRPGLADWSRRSEGDTRRVHGRRAARREEAAPAPSTSPRSASTSAGGFAATPVVKIDVEGAELDVWPGWAAASRASARSCCARCFMRTAPGTLDVMAGATPR